MRMRLLTAALILIVITASGCSGAAKVSGESNDKSAANSNATAAPKTDSNIILPEQLISKAEAENILGGSVTAKDSEQPVVGLKQVFYDAGEKFLQVSITQQAFIPAGSANIPKSLFDSIKSAFPDSTSVDIGDEAFISSGGYYIMRNGYYIIIMAGNDTAVLDKAGKLAVKNLDAILK